MPGAQTPVAPLTPPTLPAFRNFAGVFARIGCLSFGGPAGQIALMHRELIDERHWIEEGAFLRALNFCHLLPGPEAQQLAVYIGWRMFGLRGGLVAGMLFIAPGALVMLALSILYVSAAHVSGFDAVMVGIKAAVIAIVIQALIRIARRSLGSIVQRALAVAAFLALFVFALPFPVVILAAGAMGALLSEKGINAPTGTSGPSDAAMAIGSVRTVAVGMAIWGAPVLVAIILLGQQHVLIAIAAFFSKLAIVTFGGAYAVLAYMAQAAVTSQGWLTAGQMADGLGLAETTPGPLILVTQYVGFLAGWHAPAPFTPLLAGMLASVMTLWVTFVPCFIWIFAFAPWVERLEHARRLHAAMAAIAAAVVGVIANLSLWFALHVLFGRVHTDKWGIITTQAPEWSTFDGNAAVLATGAIIATLRYGRSPLVTILGTALASVAFSLLTF